MRLTTKARRAIAKACRAAGIKPGVYRGKKATGVIRSTQRAVVKVFENEISRYNKESLHRWALGYYATQLHETIINRVRYVSFRDLEPAVQHEFEEKTRSVREKHRRNLRTAQYLLEGNLVIQHRRGTSDCSKDEFEDLLAFADWLVVLQDNSDVCFHTESDVSIEVDHQYTVNVVVSDASAQQYEEILLRKYAQLDYTTKGDEIDRQYILQCAHAFLEDTGVELSTGISAQVSAIGSCGAASFQGGSSECVRGEENDLIDGFLRFVSESKTAIRGKQKALSFITLDCGRLKCLDSVAHDVLPVWERKA